MRAATFIRFCYICGIKILSMEALLLLYTLILIGAVVMLIHVKMSKRKKEVNNGDGAIIGANSVVASDIPPYAVAVGNPCRVVRMRFDDEFIAYLLQLKWWDWDIEKIERNFKALSSGDLYLIKEIKD